MKIREDGFEQLVDCVPITMQSNQRFKFKCCDCGLTHTMVIATEETQEIGFVVQRIQDKITTEKCPAIDKECKFYSYQKDRNEVVVTFCSNSYSKNKFEGNTTKSYVL